MIEHIVEWGKTKSRIDKEIFRRIDSRTKYFVIIRLSLIEGPNLSS
jgi:hypothetical protein